NLIQTPNKFVSIMNLKSVTSKLTKEQFKLLFRNLFPINNPKNYFEFSFMDMYNYLEYYPSDEKVSLILSTYEEVYNERYLDRDDLIEGEVLKLLSPEDRVKVAKEKFKKDPGWRLHHTWFSVYWRSYYSINESIPILKNEIINSSSTEQRRELLIYMIYSCKVNNDEDALLKVLEYIETRHQNERGDVLLRVFERLLDEFQMHKLSIHHWKVLDNIIQLLHIKNELKLKYYIAENLIIAKIHFNLINKLSITETIKFLFNFKTTNQCSDGNWNILEDYPEYDRKCLEEFINILSSSSLKDDSKIELINSFLCAINKFNERISCNENEIELMKVENYSWLSAEISQLVNNDDDKVFTLRENLRKHNQNLYYDWVKEKHHIININSEKEFNEWIKNPEKMKIHWEKFSTECQKLIHRKYIRRFIKKCRWYQSLPIKFAEKCFKDLTENRNTQALI
ncbi:hypothetical protein PV325_013689, partial [Microctonus aethiopoides]